MAVRMASTGLCRFGMTGSLARLLLYFSQSRIFPEIAEQSIDFDGIEGSGISANYEKLVEDLLKTDKTHVLFVEEDMVFAPNVLHILARKRQPIVGCTYPMRVPGAGFTALSLDTTRRIATNDKMTGLEEACYVPMGVTLVELEVFRKVAQPWFLAGYKDNHYSTQDFSFCQKAREVGFKSYVDHDASRLVLHNGFYNYSWKDYESDGKRAEVDNGSGSHS